MAKINKPLKRAQTFSEFFDQTHVSGALIVFALLALLFAILEFSNALPGR